MIFLSNFSAIQLINNFDRIISDIAQPKRDWEPEDVATVGELLLDVSIQLART